MGRKVDGTCSGNSGEVRCGSTQPRSSLEPTVPNPSANTLCLPAKLSLEVVANSPDFPSFRWRRQKRLCKAGVSNREKKMRRWVNSLVRDGGTESCVDTNRDRWHALSARRLVYHVRTRRVVFVEFRSNLLNLTILIQTLRLLC